MRLVKRSFASQPLGSITLWLIPTMSYLFMKMNGVEYHREWIWWMVIPVMVLIWVLINWKIKK
jgi:hypothetical protein